jgi:DNA-directed RNA polymerase I subunit RPA2
LGTLHLKFIGVIFLVSVIFGMPGISSFYNSEGVVKDFGKIKKSLSAELVRVGMNPVLPKIERTGPPEVLHVHLDGCILGTIASARIEEAVNYLRMLKLLAHSGVCSLCYHGFI